jgi:hypothetical protein
MEKVIYEGELYEVVSHDHEAGTSVIRDEKGYHYVVYTTSLQVAS